MPGSRLFFVQMADAPKLSMDVLSWSRHFRNFPGQGDLDVTGFMRAVLASGYSGPLSLEVFNDEFRSAPARLVARDGLRSLILIESEACGRRRLARGPVLDGYEYWNSRWMKPRDANWRISCATLGFTMPGGTGRRRSICTGRAASILC